MGVRVERKKYRITFPEGHDLHGVKMVARGMSVGELMGLIGMHRTVMSGDDPTVKLQAINGLLDSFAKALLEWNVDDEDGNPVPPDRAGLDALDFDQLLGGITAWVKEISDVAAPLGTPSTPTPKPPEIPMEPLRSTTADLAS